MTEPLPPGAFAKALQSKRASERRRRWILRGSIAALVVLLGAGAWLVFFSPVFETRDVAVEGTALLTPDDVLEAAAVETGVPLARQDVDGIETRVEELAPVRDATVSRSLPHTVEIAVEEREVVYQRERKGRWEWVDADGVVFRTLDDPKWGVLRVTTSSTDQRLLRDAATVAHWIPAEVRPETWRMTAEAVDRITLTLTGGRTVVWGSAEESELKSEVLSALLSVEATVYDVSAPRHPTTR